MPNMAKQMFLPKNLKRLSMITKSNVLPKSQNTVSMVTKSYIK